ncbi:LysE family transporter [Kitasatospora sp. NPDC048239]|uniref:LysE family transporter n=1 Tax=Kitasatospora sp. NPDC048239 TaxID=3364046 RepID=UPI0037114CF9
MDSLVGATASGVLAGLGVAVPLGAVGVLLLEEGRRGWRSAVSAASAVALVDMVYAGLATAFGARLAQALEGWEAWARAGSAVVLGVVAVRGLAGLRRPVVSVPASAAVVDGGGAGDRSAGRAGGGRGGGGRGGGGGRAGEGGAAGTFLRFAGLTLVNPATVLYFAALVTGGGGPAGWAGGAAFVLGVLAASLTWQQLLAAVGVSVGARLSSRARRLTYCAGYGLVVYYAVRMAWPR